MMLAKRLKAIKQQGYGAIPYYLKQIAVDQFVWLIYSPHVKTDGS